MSACYFAGFQVWLIINRLAALPAAAWTAQPGNAAVVVPLR
jgi:hypothetical protein